MGILQVRPLSRVAAFCGTLLLACAPSHGQVHVYNIAGGYVNDGKPAASAALQEPFFAATDSAGNVYISDFANHRIRKVNPLGIISTAAGTGISGYSGDGGSAKLAQISFPTGLAIDSSGNVLFADYGNNRIRRISTAGIITTVAGTGIAGFGGDGGPAISAKLNQPIGLTMDGVGNLFIADLANNRIRRVDSQGIIHTAAGNGSRGFSGDGGPATLARLSIPHGVSADHAGNIYIADEGNSRVRK